MLLEFILLTLLYNLMTRYLLKKTQHGITFLMLYLIASFSACKDDKLASTYDPSIPVEVDRVFPEKGVVGTQCLIYGKNFGSDVSKIEVTVNGKKAKVVGAEGDCIYCTIPVRAGTGPIKVKVGDLDTAQEVVALDEFKYSFSIRVSTLSGYTDKDGKSEIKDGKIKDAGYEQPYWIEIDKKTGDLFLIEEEKAIRRISLERDTVETLFKVTASIKKPRSLSFSVDGDTLFISNDQDQAENGISNAIALRSSGFRKVQALTNSKSCCGSACHPFNPGEYYFSQWNKGTIFKWSGATNTTKPLFELAGGMNGAIIFEPNAQFAYIVDRDKHNIYKSFYNEQTHELMHGSSICGKREGEGFADGVGGDVRFRYPAQGCFDEEGNFYVCDQGNYCIRKMTPDGVVSTFAGRPEIWGYADGDLRKEAQFNRPHGIAYDPATETFYIADKNNKRIRTILKE